MPDLNYYKDHLEELAMRGLSSDEQRAAVADRLNNTRHK